MIMIAWLDLHHYAVTAIASIVAAVGAIGSWVCTVWSDRRTQIRFDKQDAASERPE